MRLKKLLFAVFFLTLTGCSLPQAYSGPKLPDEELSTIRGYSTICYGVLKISDFDGSFSGYRFQAKPGPHQMKVQIWGEPFIPDAGEAESPWAICTYLSTFEVSFDTKPGLTYSFDLRDDPNEGHMLAVSESNNSKEIDSHPHPAEVKRTYFKRRCTLSSYYYECFDW